MTAIPRDVGQGYCDLARLPKYQHFVRIPDRIIQCIDYFGIVCDRTTVRTHLHSYYLFIGVVDDAIDSGRIETGKLILEYLRTPVPRFDEEASRSSIRLITEVLKYHIGDRTYPVMMDKLRELYGEVVVERSATSIDSYIGHRESVGALTAELSYLLISPGLNDDNGKLCEFMKQVGALGCLIDSLIDLKKDHRLGLLAFQPSIKDHLKLVFCILRDGMRISLKHPRLCGLFLQAIVDNVRDRFRADPNVARESFTSERKGTAPGVA
jgi:hypothetical protein